MMRITIVLDDKLMADTLLATGLKTKRKAVELGLRALLRLRQQSNIKKLRGTITWEGDLDALRFCRPAGSGRRSLKFGGCLADWTS